VLNLEGEDKVKYKNYEHSTLLLILEMTGNGFPQQNHVSLSFAKP